jgi:hypothetical protein
MSRLLLGLVVIAAVAQTPSPSRLFRDPGAPQVVGIHYWLQDSGGTHLTMEQAREGHRYSLHMRGNTLGYLTVWSTADGKQVTPMVRPTHGDRGIVNGFILDRAEFVAPGDFQLGADPAHRLIVLFARGQQEQVLDVESALSKMTRLVSSTGPLGPALMSESVSTGANRETYVVNRYGSQVSFALALTR